MQPQLRDEDRDMTPEHEYPPEDAPTMALQKSESQLVVDSAPPREITPQQARNESVAATLDAAYRNASTLKLTPEESQALAADFEDEAFRLGAGGDDNLLYLEHAYLRRRLNDVLGVGAATPIRRREWAEEFTYFKDRQEKRGVRVYVDLVLIVRGCVVGEAIGDAVYYPDNAKQNYSDALESAKSNAFRRAAKEFGVGLQPWMKGFCEAWKQRNRGGSQSARREYPTSGQRTYQKTAPQTNVERPAASPASVLPQKATEKTREWAIEQIAPTPADVGTVHAYMVHRGWISESDMLNVWPLEHVPTSRETLKIIRDDIQKWHDENFPKPECKPMVDTDLPPEIAESVITVPRRGMKRDDYLAAPDTVGSLYIAMKSGDQEAQRRLWGLVKGWNPEPYVDANGKKWPVKQEDAQCRIDLDTFADWYDRTHGKQN